MMRDAEKDDCNEAETRRRIERIFDSLMGYDVLEHLSRERAVRGPGETEHVDFAIQLDDQESAPPVVMVEIKRIGISLRPKHLRQVSSYAINAGCEWTILTNGREWRLYHITFGQPPVTKLVRSWDLLADEAADLAKCFDLVSHKSVKRGKLSDLWEKTNVLLPRNMLQAILCEDAVKAMRRDLRRRTGVLVPLEDVVGGLRRLLNESALAELEGVRISIPGGKKERKRQKRRGTPGLGGEERAFDRGYWEQRVPAEILAMADSLLLVVQSIAPHLEFKYTKFYIGLAAEGRPDNFVAFVPRKKVLQIELRMAQSSQVEARIRDAGLDLIDYSKYGRYRVRLLPGDLESNRGLLEQLLRSAHEESGRR
jgi:hypothetical protein